MTVAAIVAKLGIFLMNVPQEKMAMYTIFVNLLIVLIGSFFIVRYYKMQHPEADVKSQVKAGMKGTTIFAVFMSLFVHVYYNYIDTHYFPDMIESRVELAEQERVNNPDIDVQQVRQMGEQMFNPTTHATITLFGLTLVGGVYTFLVVLLMRKIPGFR